jgi:diguanylate cyclase
MSPSDYERTISVGEKAFAHIRGHRTAAYPKAYELWYTYVTGNNPALTRAVNETLRKSGRVTQPELDEFYDRFMSSGRLNIEAERAATKLMVQVDAVGNALNDAKQNISEYRGALDGSVVQMDQGVSETRLRSIVSDLLVSTRTMSRTNSALSDQLMAARTELNDLRETLETVRSEAQIDPVTTLCNRSFFDTAIVNAARTSEQTGQPLSLIITDIDHFKAFNDTHGHLTGDQVLRLVALAIKQNVRSTDTSARFGGEEFAVILPACTLEAAAELAEKVRAAVSVRELIKRSTNETLGRVTISIGVATLRPGESPVEFIERADKAMYAAKAAGRNNVMTEITAHQGSVAA